MPALTQKELHDFLTGGRHILKLASLSPDGWPYVVPVWYHYDGQAFHIAARRQNFWVAYIQKDPRVSICVDTYDAPYTRVIAKARAEIVDMNWYGNWEPWAVRYIGQQVGHRYYEATKHIPRVWVRITPIKFVTWTGGDWHPRYLT